MARILNFKTIEDQFSLEIEKLDGKKLYGWKEKIVLDENDQTCDTVSFSSEENIIIPPKGVAHAILDKKGNWVDKSELVTITELGEEAKLKTSSFKEIIELKDTITIEELLEHNISSIYFLKNSSEKLIEIVKSLKGIFTFEFNYRDSYEGSPAFLIENDNNLFLLIGSKVEFEYLLSDQEAELEVDDDDDDDDDDDFDFGF